MHLECREKMLLLMQWAMHEIMVIFGTFLHISQAKVINDDMCPRKPEPVIVVQCLTPRTRLVAMYYAGNVQV